MMQRKEWNGAVSEFRAAVQLLPNNSMAHNNLGIAIEMIKGGQRAALEEYRKAHELDPRNSSAKANYERLRMDLAH
jgi:Flp pilus assembly protein TadD